jgi:hypothetical protein
MIGKKRANSYTNNAAKDALWFNFFGEYLKARSQKWLLSYDKLYVL